MKAFVVVFVLAVAQVSYQEDFKEVLDKFESNNDEVQRICIEKTGVDPQLVDKAVHYGDFADDPKMKCYSKCYLQAHKIMGENGEIYEGPIKKHIAIPDPELNDKVYRKCAKDINREVDLCETAQRISSCIFSTAQELLTPPQKAS